MGQVLREEEEAEELSKTPATVAWRAKCAVAHVAEHTRCLVMDKRLQTSAASALACALAFALAGGLSGLLSGACVGLAVGFALALVTFGLSIPVCAAVGGFLGLFAGGVAGALAGVVFGFVGGYVVFPHLRELAWELACHAERVSNTVVADFWVFVGTLLISALQLAAAAAAAFLRALFGEAWADPVALASVLASYFGAASLGAVGAGGGFLMGGALGGSLGLFAAPLTFGLSVPFFAALGSGSGMAVGAAAGIKIGLLRGGRLVRGVFHPQSQPTTSRCSTGLSEMREIGAGELLAPESRKASASLDDSNVTVPSA